MKSKELIISLIQQDLKHNQLIHNLERIGLDGGGVHNLRILEIIAVLMDVPSGKIYDNWIDTYVYYMNEAANFRITDIGEPLKPLAEVCYKKLQILLDIERSRKLAV